MPGHMGYVLRRIQVACHVIEQARRHLIVQCLVVNNNDLEAGALAVATTSASVFAQQNIRTRYFAHYCGYVT